MTKDTLKETGKQITIRRKELGFSQEDFAEQISISTSHMSSIENGKSNFGIKIFIRILESLELSADQLLRADTPATTAIISNKISDLMASCTADEADLLFRMLALLTDFLHERR